MFYDTLAVKWRKMCPRTPADIPIRKHRVALAQKECPFAPLRAQYASSNQYEAIPLKLPSNAAQPTTTRCVPIGIRRITYGVLLRTTAVHSRPQH